jgi:hypothetical protein
MQPRLFCFLGLICLITLLCPLVQAKPNIDLDFYKNNGYGVGNNISGTWTITAVVSSDVKYVEFYLDNQLQLNDTSTPFSWQLDTSNYPSGSHTLKAVGYDSLGEEAFLQVVRNFQETPTSTIVTIIAIIVIAVVVSSIAFALYRSKKNKAVLMPSL